MVRQFDVFAQLIARGTIADCARELNIPAAIVIETMNLLEDRMGFPIFSVNENGVKLTAPGKKLVEALDMLSAEEQKRWAEAMAPHRQTVDEAVVEREIVTAQEPPDAPLGEEIEDVDAPITPRHFVPQNPRAPVSLVPDAPTRSIVLASHPGIFGHFQEALLAFEEASPDIGIKLHLASLDEDGVVALFNEGAADIAYFYALEEPEQLASRYAWSDRISLYVSKDHPLAGRDTVSSDDLKPLSMAGLTPDNIARQLANEALKRSGVELGKAAFESDNLYNILRFIESNSAYFATFGSMARDFGKISAVRRLAFAEAMPQVQVRQAVRPALAQDPAVLALAEFLFR